MTDVRVVLELDLRRPDWQKDAACRGMGPELFFPPRGESPAAAKAVCATCPITDKCYEYARTNHERAGVWGGRTGRARQTVPTPIKHGEPGGHSAHLRRGETPCAECKVAWNVYAAGYRESKRAAS